MNTNMHITDRQMEIIEASGKILLRHGISGLTVKNLAAEMGFVESALYRHFKSKEDIFILMLSYLRQNIQERLDVIQDLPAAPEEKLKKIFHSQWTFLHHNRHFVIAMMSEGLIDESEKVKTEVLQIFTYKLNLIRSLLLEAMLAGDIKTPVSAETLLHFLMGGFRLHVLKWKLMNFQFNIITEGDQLVHDFFTMIQHHEK